MRRALLTVLLAGFVGAGVSDAIAGVTYVSQARQVRAQAGADVETISAPDFGLFDADANAAVTTANTVASARTTMQSSLLQSGLFFSGKQAFSVAPAFPGASSESVGADSQINGSVKFVLDEPHYFTYSRTGTLNESSGSVDGDLAFQLLGPNIGGPVNAIPESGLLEAGEYNFSFVVGTFNSVVQSNDAGTYDLDYNISLELAAVPLPPAVWMGLTTLASVAVAGYRRKRRLAAEA